QLTKSFSSAPGPPTYSLENSGHATSLPPLKRRRRSRLTMLCRQGRSNREDWNMSNNAVVLITGGLTGIGRASAFAFAKKGAKVVVSGRRDGAAKALAKELRSLGAEAEFINADVRRDDDVRALVDKTVARFG